MGARWFASDNNATAHPRVMEALARANDGHAVGYGDDPLSARAEAAVASLFGPGALVRLVMNGTGANVYALGCLAGQGDAVFCSDCAHVLVDETGAPTAVLGAQLVPIATRDGKILPEALAEAIALYSDMHKPRPAALSLSQPTELGTVYAPAELAELYRVAKGAGLAVHVDGARLANAAAALGLTPGEAAGYPEADAVCFGGTKNGLMFGEAVVFAPRDDLPDTARLRKTRLQLASKMRYIAAQFEAYVEGGLWLDNARAANAMAARLASGLSARGLEPDHPVDTNAVFVRLPRPIVEELRAKRFFYDWEGGSVRLMASWDTSATDVDDLLSDLDDIAARHGGLVPARARVSAQELAAGRALLRSNWNRLNEAATDERLGRPQPPITQAIPEGAPLIHLPEPEPGLGSKSFYDVSSTRRSRRRYKPEPLSLAELSFLLWSSAGIKSVKNGNAFRTVPSGGCRHPLDLIVYARRVTGLEPGLYRHVPLERGLALLEPARALPGADDAKTGWLDLDAKLDAGLSGQLWNCAAMFIWTAVPYRTEWRYSIAAAKTLLLDAGHACQALYGACEALGLGTCAQAAYDQERLDAALGLDGSEEFAVYAAPVGRV